MTNRRVVVLVVPAQGSWAPPGRGAEAWRLALAEDTYEVLAGLDRVQVAVAVVGGSTEALAEIAALTWPGTPVYSVDPARPVLAAVEAVGPAAAVVAVSYDVPDLPGLLIGKLFRALLHADLAVTPAEDGTLAAIGVRLPTAPWIHTLNPPPSPNTPPPANLPTAHPHHTSTRPAPDPPGAEPDPYHAMASPNRSAGPNTNRASAAPDADRASAGAARDDASARSGADRVSAGPDADRVSTGPDADRGSTGPRADRVSAGRGADPLGPTRPSDAPDPAHLSAPLTFDTPLSALESRQPRRHALAIGPGWHRLRTPADLARLDPGLEGWDATRTLLGRR